MILKSGKVTFAGQVRKLALSILFTFLKALPGILAGMVIFWLILSRITINPSAGNAELIRKAAIIAVLLGILVLGAVSLILINTIIAKSRDEKK
jgi:hypothetical protein